MRNEPLASLNLGRYIAVVVVKQMTGGKRTFSPVVGVNLSYAHGYPEFYVNFLNIDTSGMGDDPHVSGHKDIVAVRNDRSTDLGYANLLKSLDDRQEPLCDGFNIPKVRFLPGYQKKKLGAIKRHWLIDSELIQDGLQFEFKFWPAKRNPTLAEIEQSHAQDGRGDPLRIFVHGDNPNSASLALYQGGPNVERSIDFQFDAPLTSSHDGPVLSAETITIGGPRKTRKT